MFFKCIIKKSPICPIWCQSDQLLAKIGHPCIWEMHVLHYDMNDIYCFCHNKYLSFSLVYIFCKSYEYYVTPCIVSTYVFKQTIRFRGRCLNQRLKPLCQVRNSPSRYTIHLNLSTFSLPTNIHMKFDLLYLINEASE